MIKKIILYSKTIASSFFLPSHAGYLLVCIALGAVLEVFSFFGHLPDGLVLVVDDAELFLVGASQNLETMDRIQLGLNKD